MTAENHSQIRQQKIEKVASQALKKKLSVVGLAALPIAAVAYEVGSMTPAGIMEALASGPVPVALTAISWGLAAKIGLSLRKQ